MAEGVSPSLPERAGDAYKRLAASADALSSKSDQFAKLIEIVDWALKKLNLGVAAWERFSGGDDAGTGDFWSNDVGYAKVKRKWGIAIRTRSGNHANLEDDEYEEWLYNDAPRPLRIEAIDKIPELLEKLIKAADKTAKKIDEKLVETQALAEALQVAADQVARDRRAGTPSYKESLVAALKNGSVPTTLGGIAGTSGKGTIPVTPRSEKK